jgi:hypothetical protein
MIADEEILKIQKRLSSTDAGLMPENLANKIKQIKAEEEKKKKGSNR